MSRQNKVNPGMYTQRGRLTQDDAARELAKQRNVGAPNTWQPVQRDQMPPMIEEPEQDETDDQAAGMPAAIEKEPARAKAARPAAAKAAKPASRSVTPASRRPAKTAARKKTGPRKSAPRKSGVATATKRSKAKKTGPARGATAKAKSAKRAKTNRGKR